VREVLTVLKRRRGGGEELLAYRDGGGWRDVVTADINAYLKRLIGPDVSAKDFRTWHATVLAAVLLAELPDQPRSPAATRREIARAVAAVAAQLGNTPAVCRASYIDPRVVDRFTEGVTIRRSLRRLGISSALDEPAERARVERAVLRLLRPRP
jgi:DNA topoisomerase-1